MTLLKLGVTAAMLAAAAPALAAPKYSHIVVVIEENHDYSEVIGNPNMPYLNNTLIPGGLLLTDSHGVEHPSQPNYLDLFSGGNQGVGDDGPVPGSADNQAAQTPLTTPNLAAQLIHAGKSFTAYSENLPSPGSLTYLSDGTNSSDTAAADPAANLYARKHNPWTNWQAASGYAQTGNSSNTLPASVNQALSAFPRDFSELPTVSFVIPNQCNDQHGISGLCSDDTVLAQNADNFLKNRLGAYADWAKHNNSLLIVTWDENDFTAANHIATVFYGAGVPAGTTYGGTVNHFDVLRTIEGFYGLPGIASAAGATQIPVSEPVGANPAGAGPRSGSALPGVGATR